MSFARRIGGSCDLLKITGGHFRCERISFYVAIDGSVVQARLERLITDSLIAARFKEFACLRFDIVPSHVDSFVHLWRSAVRNLPKITLRKHYTSSRISSTPHLDGHFFRFAHVFLTILFREK